jgi:hypothetical protein
MGMMHKYLEIILRWMTVRGNGFRSLIFKVTGAVKRVLEKVKSTPIQEMKPVIIQPDLQIHEPQRNKQMKTIPDTKNPDRIFQMGIVGLGISFIGLIIGGIIYLFIVWIMR